MDQKSIVLDVDRRSVLAAVNHVAPGGSLIFALLDAVSAVQSNCLIGGLSRDGNVRRFKPGVDDGLVGRLPDQPLHHLRALDFLSKRWGPPQTPAG
jgi:hypothetical protein